MTAYTLKDSGSIDRRIEEKRQSISILKDSLKRSEKDLINLLSERREAVKVSSREESLRGAIQEHLGSLAGANEWLYTKMPSLGNKTPLEALKDEYWYGVLVMEILPRMGIILCLRQIVPNRAGVENTSGILGPTTTNL